jgi:hypothetical protein
MKRLMHMAWLLAALACWSGWACAQALPVAVTIADNVATIRIGSATAPMADVILTFDSATGLTPASLGASARQIDVTQAVLLSRLPSTQVKLQSAFPVMVTIEPPSAGGLVQRRVTHVEVHTHLLAYSAGSTFRLFKAQIGQPFRDITGEVSPGSVRTRGTTPGWSQFVIVADLRPTGTVISDKFAYLRTKLNLLSATERAPLASYLDACEDALADGNYALAIVKLEAFRTRVSNRAGTYIPDVWKATRDVNNVAGELLAGADTLKFSIGYLRDYGR